MGKLVYRVVEPSSKPFSNPSILDACIDLQFNGVFPDDPALGIVSERKANGISTNTRAASNPVRSENHEVQPNDPRPSRDR